MNNWTNPASAHWQDPYWSLGILPAPDQSVTITNSGYKAVNVDSSTFSGYASSLTVRNLELSAPTDALSTLLLNSTGLGAPMKVLDSCTIGTNGSINNFASSFEVDGSAGGKLLIDGGTFTQESGLTVVNAPVFVRSGSLNATNGSLTLGDVTLGSTASVGTFNQDGGSIAAQHVTLENGAYTLASGTLYAIAGTQLRTLGSFNQSGGTNYGDITLNGGSYNLTSGMVQGNVLSVAGSVQQQGSLVMNGGLLDMREINWSDQGGWYLTGYFRHGSVRCGSFSITGTANVYVETADVFVTNNLDLHGVLGAAPATLDTGVGRLRVSTVTMHDNSFIWQGGTNTNAISSSLTMEGGTYVLMGGTLESPYIGVGLNARIAHEHGLNLVHGVLSITGQYELTAGDLVTDGLYLRGSVLLWGPFPSTGLGTFTNRGLIDLGGSLGTGLPDASGGQVRLSTNATIHFLGTPAQLHFAPSADIPWTPGATLTVTNWNNTANGGGFTRLYFGVDANGLSGSQLAHIAFANPGGFPPGLYPAQILSTGEVVPVAGPVLQMTPSAGQLVLTWPSGYQLLSATNVTGPYTSVSGATSPYTNNLIRSQGFFRLQGL